MAAAVDASKALAAARLLEVIQRRVSIREWSATPVPLDVVQAALDAARLAPSAGNLQAYRVAVVRNAGARRALGEAAGQDFVGDAPVVLVWLADPPASAAKYGKRGTALYAVQDATIAAVYAQLALEAVGLASCWVGAFDEAAVLEAVAPGQRLRPIALMPCGYAAPAAAARARRHHRRRLEEFVALVD